jgi:hypothetical protein
VYQYALYLSTRAYGLVNEAPYDQCSTARKAVEPDRHRASARVAVARGDRKKKWRERWEVGGIRERKVQKEQKSAFQPVRSGDRKQKS